MSEYKGYLVNGKAVSIVVKDKKIESITDIPFSKELPLIGVPLVDCQNNGAVCQGYNRLYQNMSKIDEMVTFYRRHGVNRVLLTTTTTDPENLYQTGAALTKLFETNRDYDGFFPGVFHEGIFMSKQDGWRGAHPLKYVKDPDYQLFKKINDAFNGRIKLVNVAPEEPGGMDFIEKAVNDGVRVAIGHACPTADEVSEAVKRGATMVTHFGNGATPVIHRHRNPFWSFLAHDELQLGIIPDGHHLPKDLIQAAIKAKGPENLVFVSDCSSLTGMPAGVYGENGNVTLEANGYLHLTGQEILSGAWHQLDRGVELLCEMGWSLSDAWRQCSEIPAKSFQIPLDEIKVGNIANFVISRYSDKSGLLKERIVINGDEFDPLPVNPIQN